MLGSDALHSFFLLSVKLFDSLRVSSRALFLPLLPEAARLVGFSDRWGEGLPDWSLGSGANVAGAGIIESGRDVPDDFAPYEDSKTDQSERTAAQAHAAHRPPGAVRQQAALLR